MTIVEIIDIERMNIFAQDSISSCDVDMMLDRIQAAIDKHIKDLEEQIEEAHKQGYEEGYDIGVEVGHSEGYDDGYKEGRDYEYYK